VGELGSMNQKPALSEPAAMLPLKRLLGLVIQKVARSLSSVSMVDCARLPGRRVMTPRL
jgi:hypothetical protein